MYENGDKKARRNDGNNDNYDLKEKGKFQRAKKILLLLL